MFAYSKNSRLSDKPIDVHKQLRNRVKYVIVGQIDNQIKILIPDIEDLAEGAAIVTTLNKYLEAVL